MRPITLSRILAAAVTTAIATGQTSVGAASFNIDGTLASGGVATIAVPARLTLTSTGNISARTFTLTGTDYRGYAISETIAGPNNNTVTSTLTYATVTAVSVDGAVGTATSVGTSQSGASGVIPLDLYLNPFNVTLGVEISGTANVTVQYTNDDINVTTSLDLLTWNALSALTTITASAVDTLISAVTAVRVVTNSGGGTTVLRVLQSGAAP